MPGFTVVGRGAAPSRHKADAFRAQVAARAGPTPVAALIEDACDFCAWLLTDRREGAALDRRRGGRAGEGVRVRS